MKGDKDKLSKIEFVLKVLAEIPSSQGRKDNHVIQAVKEIIKAKNMPFLEGSLQYLNS